MRGGDEGRTAETIPTGRVSKARPRFKPLGVSSINIYISSRNVEFDSERKVNDVP